MQINIEKTCKEISNYKKEFYFYNKARDGFSDILKKLKTIYKEYTLLLPAFIGYSPNEGSGVFDPIIENNVNHQFYLLNEDLNVNIKDYKQKIEKIKNKAIVLIIDYFGFIDNKYDDLIEIATKNDAVIIEDCAHALYTDFIDHKCGNEQSDFVLYSLHKMLPYNNGGMIKVNDKKYYGILNNNNYGLNPFEYDLYAISKKRKENMQIIETLLKKCEGITLIRNYEKYKNQTPQTYPIIIKNKDKNILYHKLNEDGYGVVSLYHTMIDELCNNETSVKISKTILNLPVHQDVNEEQLIAMCKEIIELCKE